MESKKIKTIEMIRKIRDKNAKRLAGKSHAERITFYRERAKKMEKKIPVLLSELAIAGGRPVGYSNVDTIVKRIREKRATYKKRK
jgi:hypothetical protein